jgi:ADP-ribose pyrophosphatase
MRRVDVFDRRRVFDDFFKVDEARVSFERFDGSMSPPVRRLVFERGDSVAAVVRHRESGDLLFTEQFRYPTLGKGEGWLVEIMAGMIDGTEPPEATLRREIGEELGYAVAHAEPISTFFLSPGGSSERIFLFYAEVSDAGRVSDGGGRAEELEDIRIVRMSLDEARVALGAGRIGDAKTIIGLHWLFDRVR